MDFKKMLQDVEKLQAQMMTKHEENKKKEFQGSAGGSSVIVVISGDYVVKKIEIDPQILQPNEKIIIQDLIVAAVNNALEKVKEVMSEDMANLGANFPSFSN